MANPPTGVQDLYSSWHQILLKKSSTETQWPCTGGNMTVYFQYRLVILGNSDHYRQSGYWTKLVPGPNQIGPILMQIQAISATAGKSISDLTTNFTVMVRSANGNQLLNAGCWNESDYNNTSLVTTGSIIQNTTTPTSISSTLFNVPVKSIASITNVYQGTGDWGVNGSAWGSWEGAGHLTATIQPIDYCVLQSSLTWQNYNYSTDLHYFFPKRYSVAYSLGGTWEATDVTLPTQYVNAGDSVTTPASIVSTNTQSHNYTITVETEVVNGEVNWGGISNTWPATGTYKAKVSTWGGITPGGTYKPIDRTTLTADWVLYSWVTKPSVEFTAPWFTASNGYTAINYWQYGESEVAYGGKATKTVQEPKLNKNTDTVTLGTQANATQYTVTFNNQSGTGGQDPLQVYYGDSLQLSIALPTRTGYTFNGYYTAASGGTPWYNSSGTCTKNPTTYDVADNTTLYAQWTPITKSIALDQAGGTGGLSSVSCTVDSAMKTIAQSDLPTRAGYSFAGYYYGTTQYYNSNGISARNFSPTDSTIKNFYLTAHWTRLHTISVWNGSEWKHCNFIRLYTEQGDKDITYTSVKRWDGTEWEDIVPR